MSADLITQIVTLVLVIYFGLHLRTQLRTVKSTVEVQEKAIAAQAEQMKAQSTVLQDFERLNKLMQQVIDFVDPEAQLRREKAYRERTDRDMADLRQEMNQRAQELGRLVGEMQEQLPVALTEAITKRVSGAMKLLYTMLPFLYPGLRQALIEAADLAPESKAEFQQLAQGMRYTPVTDEASLEQFQRNKLTGQIISNNLQRPPEGSLAP